MQALGLDLPSRNVRRVRDNAPYLSPNVAPTSHRARLSASPHICPPLRAAPPAATRPRLVATSNSWSSLSHRSAATEPPSSLFPHLAVPDRSLASNPSEHPWPSTTPRAVPAIGTPRGSPRAILPAIQRLSPVRLPQESSIAPAYQYLHHSPPTTLFQMPPTVSPGLRCSTALRTGWEKSPWSRIWFSRPSMPSPVLAAVRSPLVNAPARRDRLATTPTRSPRVPPRPAGDSLREVEPTAGAVRASGPTHLAVGLYAVHAAPAKVSTQRQGPQSRPILSQSHSSRQNQPALSVGFASPMFTTAEPPTLTAAAPP